MIQDLSPTPDLPTGLSEDKCDLFKDSSGIWRIRVHFEDCFEKVQKDKYVEYHTKFNFLYEFKVVSAQAVEFRRYQIRKGRITQIIGLEDESYWGTVVKSGSVRMILCWPKFGYLEKGLIAPVVSFWFDDRIDQWVLHERELNEQ